MKIGIDVRLLEREMTGIGRVVAGILDNIRSFDKDNEYFLFSFSDLESYRKKGFTVIPTGRNKLIPPKIYSPIWLNFVLPRCIKKNNIDLFFFPSALIPQVNLKCKTVILLGDVFHKIDKKYHPFLYRKYLDLFLGSSIKKTDLILTISQNSKKDIIKFYNLSDNENYPQRYNVPEEKIKVIYLGADENFIPRLLTLEQKERLIKKYNLPSNFVLYVGNIDFRKNIDAILEVADILANKKKKDIYFVLVSGSSRHYMAVIDKKNRKVEKNHIIILNDIEREDLPLMYNLADVFFFPSFYEGFGLPVLEAMQSGLPVVASNTSSLPEVIGEGGLMHDPGDYRGLAKDIMRLLEDEDFYDKIRRRGIEQAKNFSWAKTTKEIVEIFNSL